MVDRLCERVRYVSGDYPRTRSTANLASVVDGAARPLFYLAIPPALFDDVVNGLGRVGIAEQGRVVVEKPFGRPRASAAELNDCIHRAVFHERRSPDRPLPRQGVGREPARLPLRGSCSSRCGTATSSSVQITMAEDFGVGSRGPSTRASGALRGVAPGHLLQVVALLGMEPPANSGGGVAA
ncbi:MAG: hypothetical protein R2711_11890 [Acidimicrobiales bacterium]